MKLAKSARGVLKSLGPKQSNLKPAGTSTTSKTRYNVVLTDPRGGDTTEEDEEPVPASVRHPEKARRAAAAGKDTRSKMAQTAISIHEDPQQELSTDQVEADDMAQIGSGDGESIDEPTSASSDESEDEVDESVVEDMRRLEESFKGVSQKYRLINRIGEGTFSTVYKAEQLLPPDEFDQENGTPMDDSNADGPLSKRRKIHRKPQLVALKKIYVTSSPHRIMNELELLHELRHSPYICPLLTAFRHLDQVVAVLPYFRHLDFRLFYRDFLINDMRHYFRCLLNGLRHVHHAGILHRDIKPTNFLYDHSQRSGVLVDFGLAERQGTDWQPCLCQESSHKRRDRFMNSHAVQMLQSTQDLVSSGYPKNDQRPSRRANRAGTRGFRAPEVLFKCTSQTTKIDMWSTGVILLTLLSRRFPFFNSADDVDAMIEMASIFGRKRMQSTAALHGQLFETNIDTIGERGFTFEKIILWASCRKRESDTLRRGEEQAVDFLQGLLELDPHKRWSAKEALQHPFFTAAVEDEDERQEREALEAFERRQRR